MAILRDAVLGEFVCHVLDSYCVLAKVAEPVENFALVNGLVDLKTIQNRIGTGLAE